MTAFAHAVRGIGGLFRQADRVWLTVAILFIGLVILNAEQAGRSFVFAVESFLWILPFLLISVLLAAGLKGAGADSLIALAVSRRPVAAILIATLAGAFSPFCSCGVVPLVAALLAAGVPLSAVMAFWLSSPIMDPEMFVLMAVQLPMPFTLAKVAAAVAIGAIAGFATLGLERLGYLGNPLKKALAAGCGTVCAPGLSKASVNWRFWREPARRAAFASEAKEVSLFLTKWLVLAFALESLMVAWLPGELVARTLGGEGWSAVPIAVAVGVPAYLNGYAAIPLIGQLMEVGMAPGAALAFMVAGGVTSLPASTAVFAIARGAVFGWYIAVALVGSLLIGYAYQLWVLAI
jgi:uncharacterized membrane protein YraQ (UPF0718 family)